MAGREVDRPVELLPLNLVGDRWRGCKRLAQQRSYLVLLQNRHSKLRKFLGVESRVVPDQNCRILRFAIHLLRDGRHGQSHVRKRKIVGNQSAPSGRAKLDRRNTRHGGSAHTVVFYSQSFEDESILRNFPEKTT